MSPAQENQESPAPENPGDPGGAGLPDELVRHLSDAVSRLAGSVAGPLRRVSLQAGGAAIELEWHGGVQEPTSPPPSGVPAGTPPPNARENKQDDEQDHEQDDEQDVVRSPMVGTFYHAPAPGEPPFVAVGGMVEPDTVVGIVEAMKLMNQITAERAGVVRNVLVPDGKPVEFEQPLLVLDPLPDQDWTAR